MWPFTKRARAVPAEFSVETDGAHPVVPPLEVAIGERAEYGAVSYRIWALLTPEERELMSRMSPTQARKRIKLR